MAGVTGQAGVTIEMATKISIGQLTYQDEGRLNVTDIQLSGRRWISSWRWTVLH